MQHPLAAFSAAGVLRWLDGGCLAYVQGAGDYYGACGAVLEGEEAPIRNRRRAYPRSAWRSSFFAKAS